MSYIGNSPGVASQRVTTTLTATAAQTQFTTQSGYVLGYVDVYLNGAKLVNGADFEAITGTYITLFAGAAVGDVVELVSYVPRGLTDGYTKAEADAKFLDVGGDTASGSLSLASASLTGALTLSGGTAGGLAYLNGSKVLTTGSNLTFDGSQYQKLTTTTYSDGGFVNARTSLSGGTFNTYDFMEGTTVTGYLRNYGSIFGTSKDNHLDLWNTQNAPLVFGTNNTERARIDNTGNIAIGKTSASSRLHISGSSGVNGAAVTLDIGAQQHAWYLSDSFTSVFNIGSGSASSAWAWTYSGGEVARLTTAGFGINTTSLAGLKLVAKGVSGYPATSGTTQTGVFRVTGGTGLYNVLDMGVNESTDAAWIQATRANSLGTYDSLLLNPYGGKVGIGTTSPAVELDVRARARFGDGTNHVTLGYWDGFSNRIESVNKPLFLTSYSDSIRFGMSGSENMRITSTGSLSFANTNTFAIIRRNTVNGSNGISIQANTADAVDDTNAGAKIQIGGGTIGDTYEGNIDLIAYGSIVDANRNQIRFSNRSGTNTVSERMRINHLGNVGVGTTNPTQPLHVIGNAITSGNILSNAFHAKSRVDPYTSISETSSGAMSVFGHNAVASSAASNHIVAPNSGYHGHFIRMYYNHGIAFHTSSNTKAAGDVLYSMDNPGLITSGTAERMVITPEGSVGIGTSSPSASLHVVGGVVRSGNVELGRVHTDIMKMWRTADIQGYKTQYSDGGSIGYTWDNGVVRMDGSYGGHNWDIGKIRLVPGTYQLVLVYRPSPTAHDWSNFGSNSNGHSIKLQSDGGYLAHTVYIAATAPSINKDLGYSVTYTSGTYTVTTENVFRIGMATDPYTGGGYKYFIEAAYLVRLN